jgi:hypothetical protein
MEVRARSACSPKSPGNEIEQLRAELQGRWQAARAVMVLLSLHGLPPAQIVALLGRHPATVRCWISRLLSHAVTASRMPTASDEFRGAGQSELTTDIACIRGLEEAAMLYQRNAYDIVSQQRKAMLAQAAAIARASAARRSIRGSRGESAPALMSRVRISLRLRAA